MSHNYWNNPFIARVKIGSCERVFNGGMALMIDGRKTSILTDGKNFINLTLEPTLAVNGEHSPDLSIDGYYLDHVTIDGYRH